VASSIKKKNIQIYLYYIIKKKKTTKKVYTAGVVIPTPIAETRYYHRSLNPKKLIEVGFSSLGPK
jgi:glycylpeptide N-tetradecanoyltransferase